MNIANQTVVIDTRIILSDGGLAAAELIQKELRLAPIKALVAAPSASGP